MYDPAIPTRRQRTTWGHGLISLDSGKVRVDIPYTPPAIATLRQLTWRYGGGFRRDESGPYWLVGLSGVRAVSRAFPALVVAPAARQAAQEQAWTA